MRMRQHLGEGVDPAVGGISASYAYAVGSGDDPSTWRDEELAQIFRNMRLAMKVSRETIARRLATSVASVETFEAGAVGALPHGKETERIVRGYCELLRMDPEPILWRIRGHLQAAAGQAWSGQPTAPPRELPGAINSGRTGASRAQPGVKTERTKSQRARQVPQAPPQRRRRRVRALFALSAPVALVAVLVYLAHALPLPVYRVVGLLPDSIRTTVRTGMDYLVVLTAPRRDGLRWIEVSDPRVRKADKMQTGTR